MAARTAVRVALRSDVAALEYYKRNFSSKVFERAYVRAANRTMRGVRSESIRQTARAASVEPQKLLSRFFYFGRGVTATRRRLRASMRVLVADLPVVKMRHKDKRPKGVTIKGMGTLPHAFTATMPSGYTGVFQRRGRARLPISQVYIALKGLLKTIPKRVFRVRAERRFPKEMASAAKFFANPVARTANARGRGGRRGTRT